MNYKSIFCACAVLTNMTPALAQQSGSNVTFYGKMDLGYEYADNVHSNTIKDGHVSRMSQGKGTSYWGLRGREDLGGGLKGIFNLEAGFTPDTGMSAQGGRLFGRQSYVGLEGNYGRVSLGRQYTMKYWATRVGNLFGTGSHGITTLDEGIGNPRSDNSVLYLSPKMKDFQFGVTYSFGRDGVSGNSAVATGCSGENTSDSKQCRSESAMGLYDNGNWGVAAGYEQNYGGTSATWGGLTSPDITDKRYIMSGYFSVNKAKFGLGWIGRDNEGLKTVAANGVRGTTKSNLFWLTGTVPVTNNLSIDGVLAQIKYEDSSDKARVITLRPVYSLSKRTALYVSADYVNNSGTATFAATTSSPKIAPKAGGSQTSIIAGIEHFF